MLFLIDFEIVKLLKVRQKSELRKHFTFCILCKFYPDLFFLFAHECALEVDVFIHNFPLSKSFQLILMWWLCNNLVVVSCYSLGYMYICKKNHSTINTNETFFISDSNSESLQKKIVFDFCRNFSYWVTEYGRLEKRKRKKRWGNKFSLFNKLNPFQLQICEILKFKCKKLVRR